VSVALEEQGSGIIALVGLDSLIVVVETPLDLETCLCGSLRRASSAAENIAKGEFGLLGRPALPSVVPGGVWIYGLLAISEVVDDYEALVIFIIVFSRETGSLSWSRSCTQVGLYRVHMSDHSSVWFWSIRQRRQAVVSSVRMPIIELT
jgi:hypothetical protein